MKEQVGAMVSRSKPVHDKVRGVTNRQDIRVNLDERPPRTVHPGLGRDTDQKVYVKGEAETI